MRVLLTVAIGAGALVALPAAASAASPAAVVTAPRGVKTTITPGLKAFDIGGAASSSSVNCMSVTNGYSVAMVNTNETTYATYNNAAAAGMKIGLFQGYYQPYWTSAAYGTSQGKKAVSTAGALGYPQGAMIFLNLEATNGSTVILSWVKNWIASVNAGKYVAGIYVGANPGLTAGQLNSLAGVGGFWKSASTSGVPVVARGYVLRQPAPLDVAMCSTKIDNDVPGTDTTGAQLVGAAFPKPRTTPTVTGTFVPLTPTRLLDTRVPTGAPKAAVSTGGHIDLQVTGGVVPAGKATAVVLNVTATGSTADGYVTVTPTGATAAAQPVSNVNFIKAQTVANLVTVKVPTVGASAGKVTLTVGGQAGTVQLVADVAGYYVNGTDNSSSPGTFTPVTPTRLLDTRPPPPAAADPAGSQSRTAVPVTGRALEGGSNVPGAGQISAAVLNLTAVAPTAAGSLTAYAYAGQTTKPPVASNLNFVAKQVAVPNLAAVPVDPNTGQIGILNGSAGTTDLLADIFGYYSSGAATVTGSYVPITPTRILNTINGTGAKKPTAYSAIALQVAKPDNTGIVPANATAVVINVTVADIGGAGYVTVFPSDQSAPLASNINFTPGQTVANLVMVPIGADGKIVLNNHSTSTIDLIGDVAGYFVG